MLIRKGFLVTFFCLFLKYLHVNMEPNHEALM